MSNKNSGGRAISKEDESMMRTYLKNQGYAEATITAIKLKDLKTAFEAARKAADREDLKAMMAEHEAKSVEADRAKGRKVKDYDKEGGYVKQYAHGGGVRKAKFMDD